MKKLISLFSASIIISLSSARAYDYFMHLDIFQSSYTTTEARDYEVTFIGPTEYGPTLYLQLITVKLVNGSPNYSTLDFDGSLINSDYAFYLYTNQYDQEIYEVYYDDALSVELQNLANGDEFRQWGEVYCNYDLEDTDGPWDSQIVE